MTQPPEPDFHDRMFLASEAVYEQIGQAQHPDVEASLLQAQHEASQ